MDYKWLNESRIVIRNEEPRSGIFVCKCGVDIGGHVDVQAVGVMIGYRLKRALIAETYAAKHHYNWDGRFWRAGDVRSSACRRGVLWLRLLFGRFYIE